MATPREGKPRAGQEVSADLTGAPGAGMVEAMLPALPTLAASHWLMLVFKTLAALGFIWSANFVILYAC